MLDFSQAIKAFEVNNNILILPSTPVDGDSIGSALALYEALKKMGKNATVCVTSKVPDIFKFLPDIDQISQTVDVYDDFVIELHLKDQKLKDIRHEIVDNYVNIFVTPESGKISSDQISFPKPKRHYDLIVTVDTADLKQLGDFYTQHGAIFSEIPSINIDHHKSNTHFASLNLVNTDYCSASHILFELLKEMQAPIDADIATLLLAGIITDTGSFQNSNTTPASFDAAAELIDLGGRQQEIIQHIYKTKQLNSLKLWGKILSKIEVDPQRRILWTSLTQEDLQVFGANNEAKGDIIDELLSNAEEADLVLLLEERPGNVLHGSIRITSDDLDATVIAKSFGGGGHAKAAGFNIENASVESHSAEVIKAVESYIDQIRSQNTTSKPAQTIFPQQNITDRPQEPTPAPEVAVEPEVKPEPTPAPEVAVEPEPEVQPEPTPAPEVAVEPEPEVQPEPTPAPEVAVQPEPEVEPEPTPAPEVAVEPEVKPEPTPAPEVAVEPEAEVEPEPELKLEETPSEKEELDEVTADLEEILNENPELKKEYIQPTTDNQSDEEIIQELEEKPKPEDIDTNPDDNITVRDYNPEVQADLAEFDDSLDELDKEINENKQAENENSPAFNEDDLLNELEDSGFDVPDHIEPGKENQGLPTEPKFGEHLQITDEMTTQTPEPEVDQKVAEEKRIEEGVKNFMAPSKETKEVEKKEEEEDLPPLPEIPDDL